MKKIVFVINSVKQARCIRRVEEFISNGYDVDAYGFDREGDNRSLPKLDITILGVFNNGTNYLNRIRNIRNELIHNVVGKYNPKNTIFYLFNLDIVMAFRSILNTRRYQYIYEVSDLAELVVPNKIIRRFLVWQNKRAMLSACHNVFTSEGFCDYYTTIPRDRISVIPNKVNTNCPKIDDIVRNLEPNRIRIGFVGIIRFETVLNFAKVCRSFKNIEFHLYGMISNGDKYALELEQLTKVSDNISLHGPFQNPKDLPSIYESIDMVLSAYPPTPGVIYAEPNKLYEAIYFRCPIIVNQGTFLGKKVERLNVGYVIDAMDENKIRNFLESLNALDYQSKIVACRSIPQNECLNKNDEFFKQIEQL